jgi:hypothetical protein
MLFAIFFSGIYERKKEDKYAGTGSQTATPEGPQNDATRGGSK